MIEEIFTVDIVLGTRDADIEDAIGYTLWDMDIAGFEQHDDETFSVLVEEPYPLPAGAIRWRVNVEEDTSLADVERAYHDALSAFPEVEITVWKRDITGYRTAWMQHFNPTRVSPRILIHPPWDEGTEEVPVRINIDPGMAFGTGTHETTRLCLSLLDAWAQTHNADTVLDVGMGSGILSIAAARLLGAKIVGMDIDEPSTKEAIRNADINGVASQCTFETGELSDDHPTAALVIANILPHILIRISDDLIKHVNPGGTLILSGILNTEEERVRDHFDQEPMVYQRTERQHEWCAMVFTRPSLPTQTVDHGE